MDVILVHKGCKDHDKNYCPISLVMKIFDKCIHKIICDNEREDKIPIVASMNLLSSIVFRKPSPQQSVLN